MRVDLTENCGVVKISMRMKYPGLHFEESTLIIATVGYKINCAKCSQNNNNAPIVGNFPPLMALMII